ncbi:MAG: DUF429 domain-containing protein [Planctomycetota bacterium]
MTSTPTPRKPITAAVCTLRDAQLTLNTLDRLTTLDALAELLETQSSPTLFAIDAPFGMPRRLLEQDGWPRERWTDYAAWVATLDRPAFKARLEAYRNPRPPGDKQHRRRCDVLARSKSPMMVFGVPVGLMFHELAPRLAATEISIPLLRENASTTIAIEAYPALVAERPAGRQPYKNDQPAKQSAAHRAARTQILAWLASSACHSAYACRATLRSAKRDELLDDGTGDALDALLAAVQGAWAWNRRDAGFGIPPDADPLEGWIMDPALI